METTKEFLEYIFTEEEIKELSNNLARSTSERIALESEKKAIVSEFSAKINGKEAELESLANKINSGKEHRYVECILEFNWPEAGFKTLIRQDNKEIVSQKKMTPEELQLKLNFNN